MDVAPKIIEIIAREQHLDPGKVTLDSTFQELESTRSMASISSSRWKRSSSSTSRTPWPRTCEASAKWWMPSRECWKARTSRTWSPWPRGRVRPRAANAVPATLASGR